MTLLNTIPNAIENPAEFSQNWMLTEVSGNISNRREVFVNTELFRVGRSSESNLTLVVSSVSKRHAQLRVSSRQLFVEDLGSTNGTTINGHRVTTAELKNDDLLGFADAVFRVNSREIGSVASTLESNFSNWAEKLLQFDQLLNGGAARPFFQPIVRLEDRNVIGHELLARSDLEALKNPALMFEVAEALDQERALSELMRRIGCREMRELGSRCEIYVNTHAKEISDLRLIKDLQTIRDDNPDLRLVIEIHEAAVTDLQQMRELRAVLNDLDMRLAYDDFGAGQARLVELSEIPPDVLKFDMSLIRNIDTATLRHQSMIQKLVEIVFELGIEPLAEGVETEGEHEVCQRIGFVTGQGWLYGRPIPKPQR